MDPAVASALLLGLASLGVGLLTYRNNRAGQNATAVIEGKKVDLEEFREVQARNEAALRRADEAQVRADQAQVKFEERIAHLEEALMDERKAREAADERAQKAEERAEKAEMRAERLERRVDQLEQVLRDNDMTVPPALPD